MDDPDATLRQVSKVLSSKAKKKGGPAPAPPRRTTSCKDTPENSKDMETELKAKMKLQKAKIESSTLIEHYGEDDLMERNSVNSDFAPPTFTLQPGKRLELGSPKNLQRMDSKESANEGKVEDSGISQSSTESLKRTPIDKSKYLINVDSALKSSSGFESSAERSSGRKFPSAYHRETRLASEVENTKKSDKETSTVNENTDNVSFKGKQYPKKALPLPQHALQRRKYSDHSPRFSSVKSNSMTSRSMDAETSNSSNNSVTIGRLDVNNVTKAISRYGTIPKGRRIEAYLASMESGVEAQVQEMPPPVAEDHDSGTDTASVASCPVLLPEENHENVVEDQLTQSQVSKTNTSDPGIKPEPNVKPSAFVKSQSQHTIVENQNSNYMLQRHKSDLMPGASNIDPSTNVKHYSDPVKPKPSPRLSRMFADHDQDVGHDPSRSEIPTSLSQGMFKSVQGHHGLEYNNDAGIVGSPDGHIDMRNKSDYKTPMRPAFTHKIRSASTGDYPLKEEGPHEGAPFSAQQDNKSASVLSKVAMFQSAGPDFGSFKPFVRGENERSSLRDDRSAGYDSVTRSSSRDEIIYKPVLPKTLPPANVAGALMQSSLMSKSMIETLEPVPETYAHGQNSDSDTPSVSRETIYSTAAELQSCIESLTTVGNKTSTNFMVLSDNILHFHDLCSHFIDTLPPHAKFQAKELLSRLQTHSENVKTFCSTNPASGVKVISDVKATIQEVIDLIKR